ncbi:unnamed protein product [Brassica oleracea var. botrytis]|uniref:Uncharacterized protein n=1 Tax=Brassica oleracea TaxID=3712 RepID=A0A3P6FAQ2_BRAOL|nr:unnamed protein product [Brassica oleracea]
MDALIRVHQVFILVSLYFPRDLDTGYLFVHIGGQYHRI